MALVKQHRWKFGFVETKGKILIYYTDLYITEDMQEIFWTISTRMLKEV